MATSAPSPPDLRRLSPGDERAFEQLYEIYADVFPASERKSRAALHAMLATPEYNFLVELERDAVIAFAIVRALQGVDATLLEYMAVRRNAQDKGRGGRMFLAVARNTAFLNKYILLEVEDERRGDPKGTLARRKQFYRALDCVEVEGLDYIMPAVGRSAPPPMNLLVHRPEPVKSQSKIVLASWLCAIYSQVYSRSPSDNGLIRMLESLPETVRFI